MKFRIREARERAGYSQKELAEIIGVAQNTFHGYESGKHDPKSELLSKIATACNVTVDFLLGRDTEHPSVIQVDFGHGEMDAKKAPPLSGEAMRLAKDYDSLDRWGRQALRELAETELKRMRNAFRRRRRSRKHHLLSTCLSIPPPPALPWERPDRAASLTN